MNQQYRNVLILASIMAFRMLGMFMILPVFSSDAILLPHANAELIGLAIGSYGLTQALLQIPFGMLSDRLGRKPIIISGLVLFALGSVIAALFSHNIYGIIVGRAIQGAGSIGSVILALVADLTDEQHRSKAMAMVGLTIGCAFTIAMILGPLIHNWFQLQGIFWSTAILALLGIGLISSITPPVHNFLSRTQTRTWEIIKNRQLLRFNWGIFSLHTIFTALFTALPLLLAQVVHLSETQQSVLYLIIISAAFFLILPFIFIAEKKHRIKELFICSILMLMITPLLILHWQHHLYLIGLTLILLFAAFSLLEAFLPSLISKIVPSQNKGTAMGFYSTSQFLGIFVGGSMGGWVLSHFNIAGVFIFASITALFWLPFAFTMQKPPLLTTLMLPFQKFTIQEINKLSNLLTAIPGIAEVAFLVDDALIQLKIDLNIVDEGQLLKRLQASYLITE